MNGDCGLARVGGLDQNCFRNQRAIQCRETELPKMRITERCNHIGIVGERHKQRRVRALILHVQLAGYKDLADIDVLLCEFPDRGLFQRVGMVRERRRLAGVKASSTDCSRITV